MKSLMPSRIRRVREEFLSVLGTPSILRLVPILRENMPDYLASKWLKENFFQDAQIVLEKAKSDGMVDIHVLNSMLEVMTSYGDHTTAIEFHEKEYNKKGLKPTTYGRTIIQYYANKEQVGSAIMTLKECIAMHGLPPGEASLRKLR